jgi:hypothetical protein
LLSSYQIIKSISKKVVEGQENSFNKAGIVLLYVEDLVKAGDIARQGILTACE